MNCKLTLQEKLKDLRTEQGLSLIELSEKTGISKSALGSYERCLMIHEIHEAEIDFTLVLQLA